MPLVVKTLTFNSLVWYPKLAHLSINSIYPLYILVAPNSVAMTNIYTEMSLTFFLICIFYCILLLFERQIERQKVAYVKITK